MPSRDGRGPPSRASQIVTGMPASSTAGSATPNVSTGSHRANSIRSTRSSLAHARARRRLRASTHGRGATVGVMSASIDPHDLLDIDHLLSDDERRVRDTAREWVRGRILPEVDEWYEAGEFPARELAKELGE